MNAYTEWLLIGVVIVAFVAGYSIVSFLVKKLRSKSPNDTTTRQGASQSKSNTKTKQPSANDTYSEERDTRARQEDQYQRWKEDEAKLRNETRDSQNEDQRHARVLGLRGRVTPSDVKGAYRELITKYHPDKVIHLGDEFKQIAEQRTREIIAAYEYFRTKYNIR